MTAGLSDALRTACHEVGILFRNVPADGRWYPTDIEGDRAGRGDGRIKLFPDGEGGIVCNWKGDTRAFFANNGRALNAEERVELVRKRREAIRRSQEEAARRRHEAAGKAADIWAKAIEAPADHCYLLAKSIKPHGTKVDRGSLVVPMRKGSELRSLQFILGNGEKRFLPDGEVTGCYYLIGKPNSALCVCEGFATGASVHEGTGHGVAVAFNAGNLLPVARALRAKYPELELIICADNDWRTMGNPGMAKATEAARAVGAKLAVPDFGRSRPADLTDFNDMMISRGIDAVRGCIAAAKVPDKPFDSGSVAQIAGIAVASSTEAKSDSNPGEWPEPQSLVARVDAEPYPIDALPETIRKAVEEVQGFTKAPISMVASSALAVLSLAAQAHIDVKRAEKLNGPVSLDLLTIADSGERKSTCDGFFTAAIRQYQDKQSEKMQPELDKHRADFAAWEAEREGILAAIKTGTKAGKSTSDLKADLAKLEGSKPKSPRIPRLLIGDETPENLAWSLARQWPSAGVLSSEGGLILGAHAMGKDSVMRNMALLNVLWDGGTHSVGRRTSESFTVRGARLTVALQVQEATLRSFFERTGALARGSGFLARFLVAWPESTQGHRQFTEAPANWPHLAAFHRRIEAILDYPVSMDEGGALAPSLLSLASDAKAAWVAYHDQIEGELRSGGELYDVRDVASKSADNVARLAALFQMFERGVGGIGKEAIESASRIAAWHLHEALRFFGGLALPVELADATRLDGWLIDHCRRKAQCSVAKNYVRQHGPLRDGARLDVAIRELGDLDRLRLVKDGKRLTIHLAPALTGVAP